MESKSFPESDAESDSQLSFLLLCQCRVATWHIRANQPPKKTTQFKSGQNWPKNNHLALLIKIGDTLCTYFQNVRFFMLTFFLLSVPRVRIFGDRDIFVKSSSTVQLKCVISQSLSPPTYIEWLRNDEERLPSSFLGVSSAVSFDQVSISPTFYKQLLRTQILKVQKRLTTWLSFLCFRDLQENLVPKNYKSKLWLVRSCSSTFCGNNMWLNWNLGSISPTFYKQLLRTQILKVQKRLTPWLSFLCFRDLQV